MVVGIGSGHVPGVAGGSPDPQADELGNLIPHGHVFEQVVGALAGFGHRGGLGACAVLPSWKGDRWQALNGGC